MLVRTMRLFFALDFEPSLQHAIDAWRRRSLPPTGRHVPVANLHITLCFLGEVDAGKLQHVEREADRLHGSGFHLQLNEYGYFPGPGIFWIGSQQVPRELVALAQALGKVAVSAGLKREKRAYVPHVTLMRKCHSRPPEPLTPPQFELSCEGFSLYQSVPVPGGVRYRALDRWLLD